jgi:predicted nucleic acid-binding protein
MLNYWKPSRMPSPSHAGSFKPLAEKITASSINQILKSFSTLTLLAIDEKLAETAAMVRARHGIRLPDAMQVAAAIQGEATLFITNDKRLKKIDAFDVLVPSEFI